MTCVVLFLSWCHPGRYGLLEFTVFSFLICTVGVVHLLCNLPF